MWLTTLTQHKKLNVCIYGAVWRFCEAPSMNIRLTWQFNRYNAIRLNFFCVTLELRQYIHAG